MSDTQIIFRIEKETLKKLDNTLQTSGFKTRNEWFRNTVRKHLEETENKKTQNLIKRLATEGMTEDNIIQMIKEWREKDLEKLRKQAKEQREREWIRDAIRARKFTEEETFQQGMDLIKFAIKIQKEVKMRSMDDILEIVCTFLQKEGIEYVIVGGIAVVFHGIPRTTMDIDIILQIEEEEMPKLIEFLKENEFYAYLDDMKAAFKEKSHSIIEDKGTMIRLDIKGIYNEMDRRTYKNRTEFLHKGIKIYIASPEDTIANKLVFKREQDIRDAEGILVRQMEKLDHKYLQKICREMGVYEDLEKLKKRIKKITEKQ